MLQIAQQYKKGFKITDKQKKSVLHANVDFDGHILTKTYTNFKNKSKPYQTLSTISVCFPAF